MRSSVHHAPEPFVTSTVTIDTICLPKGWKKCVRSGIVHVVSLAHFAITHSRSWAADSRLTRVRLRSELERAEAEIAQLKEEIRIKDARIAKIVPRRRPHYEPTERLAILTLKAARGWTAAQTGQIFLIGAVRISSWLKRLDEEGEAALVKTSIPVNRFPDFVRHIVQTLKRTCPTMGKKKVAETLARCGLHVGVTTVKRMLEHKLQGPPHDDGATTTDEQPVRANRKPVASRRPNHTWLVDLTVVPVLGGFWTAWYPFSWAQRWPMCFWVACVIDHHSRRVMRFAVFEKQPTSVQVRSFLGRAMNAAGTRPRYLISDLGKQFDCDAYRKWCDRKGVDYRYAAKESLKATAVLERFFLSLKSEYLRKITIPLRPDVMRAMLKRYADWYHEFRPHQGLHGYTPNEVYHRRKPANKKPRFEPRSNWPADSPCARPQAKPKKKPADPLRLVVRFADHDETLPIVELKRAA